MTELRRLTETGRKSFGDYLKRIREDSSQQAPLSQLNHEPFSMEFSSPVRVDENLTFSTRYELGQYLSSLFSGIDRNTLLNHYGIWDWLALLWFDQICPVDQGQRKVRETARYIVSPDRTDYYRHLILCAWDVYSLHGVCSRLFLECPPHIHNDWTEQLASRQDIITNKELIEAADRLYWDNRRGRPKAGATDRNRAGNVRRLVRIIQQLDLTYDLHAMSAHEILVLLPREFDAWKRI